MLCDVVVVGWDGVAGDGGTDWSLDDVQSLESDQAALAQGMCTPTLYDVTHWWCLSLQ